MRKFIRTAGILAGVIVGLLAVILIGLNLYVQSLGTQARIQQELSQRFGTPVRIKAVSVTPWGGLTLSGISISQDAASTAPDFVVAKSFELHAGFSSLFSRSLVIKKISLVSPKIVWSQNEEGKWRLPGSHQAKRSGDVVSDTDVTRSAPLGSGSPSPDAGAVPPIAKPASTASGEMPKAATVLVPDIRRATVNNGDFRFLDRSGELVAAFEGVDLRATFQNSTSLQGSGKISRMSARDRFFLEKVRSPLHYDPSGLDLPRITAHAGNGDVTGSFQMQPQAKDSPFKVSIRFHDVQADQIVSDAGGSHGMIQGKLEGSFEASGSASDSTALSGTGQVILHDGQLQQYSLLVALGQVLQIEELTQLHLEEAEAKYHVTPGVVIIDELVLRSPNIKLSATGTVGFNGKLHLASQLAINEKVRAQLFKPIRQNFQPTAEPGYSAVDFQVGGTLDRPKTNLVDRVVGRDLKDLVNGILGGKKSEKVKKKKQMENAAPPSEEVEEGNTSPSEPAAPENTPSPAP